MKRTRQIFTLLLIPLDYFMVWLAFAAAYYLRSHGTDAGSVFLLPWPQYIHVISYLSLIWIAAFAIVELYRFKGFSPGLQLFSRILLGVLVAFGVASIFIFFTKTGELSRLVFGYAGVLSILFVFIGRALLYEFRRWMHYYGGGVERVGIIGASDLATTFKSFVEDHKPAQRLVFHTHKLNWDEIGHHQIDRLVFVDEATPEIMLKLIRWCEDRGITLQYVPGLIGIYKTHIVTDYSADYPLIEFQPTPLVGWGRIAKRTFDIVLGFIGLIIASPFMLLTAIAIKLDSRGPIIFAQTRIGELGEEFTFYKFRSMKTEFSTGEKYGGKEAEAYLAKLRAENHDGKGLLFKMKNDPRVTSVGRFIRRTSLDELPQLFNVFLGNMSLVGPRPALPNEVSQYSDTIRRRLLVKPGITGLWQVSGRSDADFDSYVNLDTYYIENWSLWLDLKIILLTFRVVFSKKGSY